MKKLFGSSIPFAVLTIGAVMVAAAAYALPGRSAPAQDVSTSPVAFTQLVKPNIVYILTDDQTMESVAKMPYLSSQTDLISFDRAYINNGLCCPSRATILKGQYDTHTGVPTNAQGGRFNESETLPVWLQRAGYQTGHYGKYLNAYPFGRGNYVPAGWNDWQAAYSAGTGWQLYQQYNWKLNSNGVSRDYLSAPADYQVNVLAAKMKAFITAKAAAGQPFYAEFTPSSTHSPWKASPTRSGTLKTAPVTRSPNFNYVAANQPAYLKALSLTNGAYMDSKRRMQWEGAASVDDAIKDIDNTLKAAGVYNNTILIFMTDNGYAFGSHRWASKRCEFNECSKTPLLVRYPGLAASRNTTNLISNVDIASTISQLAGATPAIPQDGRSFAPLILGQSVTWRDSMLLHWPGGDMNGKAGQPDSMPQFWGVLGDTADGRRWKYVELDTGERELYNEVTDPNEMTNLAGNATYATVQSELRSKLVALKTQAGVTAANATLRTDMPTQGTLGPDLD